MTAVTRDSISLRGAGVITIAQHAKGHRFTLDSLLLADFCRLRTRDKVLEPGAGTGIISLLLVKKYPRILATSVELEPAAYELLCRNIKDNGCTDRIAPLHCDIRDLRRTLPAPAFDAVVVNPPYTRSGAGRTSPSPERHTARHDQAASLHLWLACSDFLKNGGRFFLVFPAARLAELTTLLRDRRLEPKRLRFVHPYAERPAGLVLIESVRNARAGLEVLPPLVVHEPGGAYTGEVRSLYGLS